MRTENKLDYNQLRIGFLGAGSIAEAMLGGIINRKLLSPTNILVTNAKDDSRLSALTSRFGIETTRNLPELVAASDIVILAMKPKDAAEACFQLRSLARSDLLVISVIAGVSTNLIGQWLQLDCPIIRAMPNTSSAVGLSATGLAAGRFTTEEQLRLAKVVFESIGSVFVVPEPELDVITGLSGSGPAYIYYVVEAMEGAGEEAGLSRDMARQLTIQTLLGAAHMLINSQEDPSVLRKKVTSPGGTTQAGLEILETREVQQAIVSAVLRATERARELGAQFQ